MAPSRLLPSSSRGLIVLFAAAAASGYVLSGVQIGLTGCNQDAPASEETGLLADSTAPEAPEPPAVCSDEQATGGMRDAADAWDSCRWADALALYDARDPAALPREVEACATERAVAMTPVAANLTDLQGLVDRQRCHAAKARVAELAFAPSDACAAVLDACEADEHRAIAAEIAQSERDLEASLLGALITDVTFRQVDSGGWLHDIVITGPWDQIFRFGASGSQQAALTAFLLSQVTTAVGEESAQTRWLSRRVVLETEAHQCVRQMSTATARGIARRFSGIGDDAAASREALADSLRKLDPC